MQRGLINYEQLLPPFWLLLLLSQAWWTTFIIARGAENLTPPAVGWRQQQELPSSVPAMLRQQGAAAAWLGIGAW